MGTELQLYCWLQSLDDWKEKTQLPFYIYSHLEKGFILPKDKGVRESDTGVREEIGQCGGRLINFLFLTFCGLWGCYSMSQS